MKLTKIGKGSHFEEIEFPVSEKSIESAIKLIFEQMAEALESGKRIEIRGFGSFSLRYRPSRVARNPKTGDMVQTEGKYAAHFKPGKEMRARVNASREAYPLVL